MLSSCANIPRHGPYNYKITGSWSVSTQVVPANYQLDGISCPVTTFCMAIGTYRTVNAGAAPNIFSIEWKESTGWTRPVTIPIRLNNSVNATLSYQVSSISCPSTSFCMVALGSVTIAWNSATGWEMAVCGSPQFDPPHMSVI